MLNPIVEHPGVLLEGIFQHYYREVEPKDSVNSTELRKQRFGLLKQLIYKTEFIRKALGEAEIY